MAQPEEGTAAPPGAGAQEPEASAIPSSESLRQRLSDVASQASAQTASQRATKEASWKNWSRRKDGEQKYKFGDFSRGFLTKATEAVRDTKHKASEAALSTKESIEQRVASRAEALLDAGEEPKSPDDALLIPRITQGERWWCQVCQSAHKNHKRGDLSEERPPNARGSLEVQVLSVGGGPEDPIRDAGGKAASKPVCQLALGERLTGALQADDGDLGCAAVATLFFEEIVVADLKVHVWDRGNAKFNLGFEDKAFCGGAFVPLALVLRHAGPPTLAEALADRLKREVYEVTLKVNLLPLPLIRAKRKLEAAETSGAKELPTTHGFVVLRLRLQLFQPLAELHIAEPVLLAPRPSTVGADPSSTLKAVATTRARTGRALNVSTVMEGLDQLREEPVSLMLLQLWWAFTSLKAPLWCWPSLFVLALSWALREVGGGPAEEVLYVNDTKSPGHIEKAKRAMKTAAKAQQSIGQLTDSMAGFAAQIEKVKFALSGEDPFVSAVFAAAVAAASIAAGVGIQLATLLAAFGLLRPLIWVPGVCALLPRRLRKAQTAAAQLAKELINEKLGDKARRRAKALWQRIPDGPETTHVALCGQYAVELAAK
mmetsp:Transcript_83696/g.270621  ORF Transcript_83696/g.270621 Transcript_83696/m.270621 type:complete len:601 (+) Transcript_83696:49-1851(+)|eukprot:CAMPEP_0204119812 /NCGR_PEP_ID=MMETSP0361-20130328/7314_1 /ASSEMBLY_ACC=CAM_ASM_000343 /TAXON_ID=268821 /ORGANISM="Scrippsiella Hangoei, Strain SHTV-5" /LENGTH=600 /DNA_ID=CAMNT_0051070989 /DNA_START=55 /DNA_END=1857 /DNA_ORIENTATION=-